MINLERREQKSPLLKPGERNGKKPIAAMSRQRKASRFEVLKHQIKSWWDDRFKVGEALLEIREQKLYRADYETFDEFCESEYGFKRAHAYRLIEFADVKASVQMSPIGDKLVRESQARALAPVPEEKRVEVLTEAAKAPGPVTAKRITEAARGNGLDPHRWTSLPTGAQNKVKSGAMTVGEANAVYDQQQREEKPVQHLDRTGYPIPEGILEDWRWCEAFQETLTYLSRIKVAAEKGIDDQDPRYREITNTTVATLKNAYGDLKRALPYAVCPTCQGRTPKKCTLCKGRGFISEFLYSTAVPEQTKKLREAAKK